MAADQHFSPWKRTPLFKRERRNQGVVEVQQCFESAGGISRWQPRGYRRLQPGQQRLGVGKFLGLLWQAFTGYGLLLLRFLLAQNLAHLADDASRVARAAIH